MVVAVAAPKTGVTRVGEVAKTKAPVPVAPVEVTPSTIIWPSNLALPLSTHRASGVVMVTDPAAVGASSM